MEWYRSCIQLYRAVGRSENPGVPALFDGRNILLLVEIGFNDLPKSGHGTPKDHTPALSTPRGL